MFHKMKICSLQSSFWKDVKSEAIKRRIFHRNIEFYLFWRGKLNACLGRVDMMSFFDALENRFAFTIVLKSSLYEGFSKEEAI